MQLNQAFKAESAATKQMVENRFEMLSVSMQNLLERFRKLEVEFRDVQVKLQKLEERLGKRDEEVVVLRLALRKLEDDFEKLRNQVSSSQSLDRE